MPNDVEQETEQDRSSTEAKMRIGLVRAIVAFGLLAVLLLALAGYLWLGVPGSDKQTASEQPAIGAPFTLVNAAGHTVTDRDFRGKYMLIYFGYTFCPDVCPTTLNALAGALEKLGPRADRVQPLFITVDPKRDTPSIIGQYTAAFGARIIGLTGTSEQIATVEKEYRVYAAEHRTGPGLWRRPGAGCRDASRLQGAGQKADQLSSEARSATKASIEL